MSFICRQEGPSSCLRLGATKGNVKCYFFRSKNGGQRHRQTVWQAGRQTDRQTDRQVDREEQTNGQTDGQTDRQTDRQIDRQTEKAK